MNLRLDAENLDSQLLRAKKDLAEFVALESVSAQKRMLPETANYLTKLLEAEGFKVEQHAGVVAPVLVAVAGPQNAARTLLMYNHFDVQPETPTELWESLPFALTERSDDAGQLRWYARGVSDDKGEIIARLAGIRALRQANAGELPLQVKWLLEGEEEIGSPSLEDFVRQHANELKADVCWWEWGTVSPEGRPELEFGLKGIVCFELRCVTADSDLHSSLGAVIDNPLWRISKAVASLRDETGRVLIPGFYDSVRPTTQADTAAINNIPNNSDAIAKTYGVKKFFATKTEYNRRLALEPCINVNGIHGGYADAGSKTVLPASAFAKLDFRLVADQDPHHVMKLLRVHLDNQSLQDVEIIELESSQFPARSNLDDVFVKAAVSVAKEVYGQEPVIFPSSGGGGPMRPFVEFIGAPILGAGVGNLGSRIHAPNENILLRDFELGVKYAFAFLAKIAEM